MRKKETLPSVTWMNLKRPLGEMPDRERNRLYGSISMQNLKSQLKGTESRMVFAKRWGGGGREWGDIGQRVQTLSCKIKKL